MTLTKDRLVDYMRSKTEFSAQESRNIVELILEQIKASLEKGQEVKISGFGKWSVKNKTSRPGRNPHTGQKIEIMARRVVTFHPSEKMRDAVNAAKLDDSQMMIAGARYNRDEDDV